MLKPVARPALRRLLIRPRHRRAAACCPPAANHLATLANVDAASPRVVLVGNPNVGKSTLFNALTGARHHVGNWPGKTVQVASGRWMTPAGPVALIDLPGTYSLVARSPDEEVVRDVLAGHDPAGPPDLVVAVLDAANLARNLFLLTQVREMGVPVIVALTMFDVAAGRGIRVEHGVLAERLGLTVVQVRAREARRLGRLADEVAAALISLGSSGRDAPRAAAGFEPAGFDEPGFRTGDRDDDEELAERRYEWVRDVLAASVRRMDPGRSTRSDQIDRVLTSRWFGLPVFLSVMWGVFVATTRLAAPLQGGLSWFVDGPVRGAVAWLLGRIGLGGTWFAALVDGGLISGVGQLLTFVPLMTIMFVLLTLLEDSGYLARAALIADRLLAAVGLPGRAFLPIMIGFGCNVPAVAGTRILPDARHRLLTSLLVPFVTCSARLTVYVLLADAFFGDRAGTVVFAMYLLSITLVVLVGLALRHTVLRDQPREALLLELPPYRRPTVTVVAAQTWQRLDGFLRTAGGIIVVTVTAVWLLTAIPLGPGSFARVEVSHSMYAAVSRAVAPVFAPAGFDDWRATGSLLTGFVAKEAVVSTMGQTYQTTEPTDLGDRLRAAFDVTSGGHPVAAVLAFMVFLLAYTPCMATVAAQRAEIGGRWTLAGVAVQLALAWLLATVVFQIGRLLT